MKRINKKGVTLVELIVAFFLVAVASVYFYQTLTTVYKLYVSSKKETEEFVNKDYDIRIAYEYTKQNGFVNKESSDEIYNSKSMKSICYDEHKSGTNFENNAKFDNANYSRYNVVTLRSGNGCASDELYKFVVSKGG